MAGVMELVDRQLEVAAGESFPDGELSKASEVAEEVVSLLLHIWERLSVTDVNLHRKWLVESLAYDIEYNQLRTLYVKWLSQAVQWRDRAEWIAQQGGSVKDLERLKSCCQEAGGLLNTDEEFFSGPELDVLAERAAEANRRGETEPLLEGQHG